MMRYERKYRVDQCFHHSIEQIIRMHPASFRKTFPDRQVNNIYFDTPLLDAYHLNVMGASDRKKYRIRWYGSDFGHIGNAVLELKVKSNQLGFKTSWPMGTFSIIDSKGLTESIREHCTDEIYLQPVLVNAYQRSYYASPDGRFRITIDSRLRFGVYMGPATSLTHSLPHTTIVEVKFDEGLEDESDRILQYLPFRQTKSSKYVSGVDMLFD